MSKELEALERIYENEFYDMSEEYDLVKKALNELEALKKPPTVEEVCKALSEFTGQDVLYSEVTHEFYYTENTSGPISHEQFITETYGDGLWSLGVYLPPHLITLIGRFYEGLK